MARDPPDADARQPLLADSGQLPPHRDVSQDYGGARSSSDSEDEVAALNRHHGAKPTMGAAAAYGILIGIVIGSGVFTSPGSIDTNVPSPGMALIMWLVGGILVWAGATTFAELGTAIPGEGGVQPYLQHIYGDVLGFLAAWTWIVAVMPATLAILSIVFVESAYSAAGVPDEGDRISHKLLSILVLAVVSVANMISTKVTTRLNSFFVLMKFASIIAVVVAGLAVVGLQLAHPDGTTGVGGLDWFQRPWFRYRKTVDQDGVVTDWSELSAWGMLGHFSAALYGALWAYSGWDKVLKAIYLSAEMYNPAKQLPLAQNTAIPTLLLCFLAANAAYYVLLPWDIVSTTDSIAVTAMTRLLGPVVGIVAAVFICIVVAGSLLGNSFVVSRMTVAAANKSWLPRPLGIRGRLGISTTPTNNNNPSSPSATTATTTTKPATDAPINAIILSIIITSLFILFGNFRALLTLNGLGEYSFFFLTVLGAVILRYREPELRRPYKPFIGFHLVFIVVSGFVVVRGAVFAPAQAVVVVAIWLLGLLFYWARRRWFMGESENRAL